VDVHKHVHLVSADFYLPQKINNVLNLDFLLEIDSSCITYMQVIYCQHVIFYRH
jgi:hypothetical protein